MPSKRKVLCKIDLHLPWERLWYETLVPSIRKALVLEVYVFHKKGFYKRDREEYWDVFMGSKTVEFQSARVREWSLGELCCVICNGVVSVYDEYKRVMVL